MPSSLETAGKGVTSLKRPPLLRREGLGFHSLLVISTYWASSLDQPLPRAWKYKGTDLLSARQEHVFKDQARNGSLSQAPTHRLRDFLLKLSPSFFFLTTKD